MNTAPNPEQNHLISDAHKYLTAIVESSDDAILSKNLNGVIQSWNAGAERIFGYTADEVIGKHVTILIPPERENEEPDIIARIKRGERVDHYETVRRKKDGTLLNISLTVSPIKDASGKIIGASKIARDITDRKVAEETIRRTQQELRQVNETLEERVRERTASLNAALAQMQEFSYSVSHDLRGPVRAMRGYSEVLLDQHSAQLDEAGQEYLRRIMRGAARMDKLISDVLTYSRLAQDQIKTTPLNLDALVKDIIEHYPDLKLPHAEITVRSPLLPVIGHETSLTQAISNLLSNAKKFVAPEQKARVEIWTELRAGKVRFHVKDEGIGIKPESQRRLFGMFERVHHEANYEGTGIGLAIVRKAVEKMGGNVGVESDGTRGSMFWIELPFAP